MLCSSAITRFVQERKDHVKQLQILSGATVIEYIISRLLYDVLFYYTIVLILATLMFVVMPVFACPTTIMILLLFPFAFIPLLYMFSYIFEEPILAYSTAIIIFYSSFVAGITLYISVSSPSITNLIAKTDPDETFADAVFFIVLLHPLIAVCLGLKGRNIHIYFILHLNLFLKS
jgi:hypothetical protein